MKKVFLFLAIVVVSTTISFGQMPMMGGGGGQSANIGRAYGKIIDTLGRPLEFISVMVMTNKIDPNTKQIKEVMVKGLITKANGEFDFNELPIMGKLKLKVSLMGYKTVEMPITFQMPTMGGGRPAGSGSQDQAEQLKAVSKMLGGIDKDLGKIKLREDNQTLQTVTVTATKPLLENDIDKKVFNVEKNMVTTGGTAVDIMRNVPTVQVDIDGNVKLRNAAPQIYVDGRPSTLSLDQIPADAIEKVEIITNPSAKYDASGGNAGILNIILKKNKKTGYNGMVNAGADRFGGGNVLGNFNTRQGKINLSAIAMTNQMRNRSVGQSSRTTNAENTITNFLQDSENKTNGGFSFGRLGLDYFVTNRTTLSAAGIMVQGKFDVDEDLDINTTRTAAGKNTKTYSNRLADANRLFKAKGLQLGLKHNFEKAGEEFTADFNYFGGKNEGGGLYTTNYYTAANTIYGSQIQQNVGNGSNSFVTIQTDYTKPFGDKKTIEIGLRAQLTDFTNLNENLLKPIGATNFQKINAATTNYENQTNVYAAYVSTSGSYKKAFSYKLGLRAESSNYTGKLLNTGASFGNKYPISLFPSVFLSKELTKTDQLQMSLTRRINRPNFFQLIPFIDYTDSLNITQGNGNLVPEFTYSTEGSYTKTKGNNTYIVSAYYKYTDNLITRYLGQDINPITGKKDLINTYVNANSSNIYGVEFTTITKPTKWWDLTTNINFYNSQINIANIETASTPALWSMFGKLNNNLKLPKKYTAQLSFDYQSKTNLPVSNNAPSMGGPPMQQTQSASQGYIKPFYGVDLAIKKSFLKDALSATLSFNDIFRSRFQDQYSSGAGFTQTYYRLSNPQMIRLNLSYRFGKMDVTLFKRQNLKSQQEGMQNGMQMN